MRIGFATIYSWRPHVEHAHFLAGLVERAGHQAHFLTCDADLPTCYTRELRDRPSWRECLECRAGGMRSYTRRNVDSVGALSALDQSPGLAQWSHSSASTLGRFESEVQFQGEAFRRLAERMFPAAQLGFRAARAWIQARHLDAVCVFNGRMDVTRGIFEAAKSLGVRVVSLERPWFSNGLQLYPEETCMGLQSVHRLIKHWRERPLTNSQAILGASYVARRFLRQNTTEWRAYNVNAKAADWPVVGARRRVLLLPSSRNEVWGQPDWESDWRDPLDAYDALIEHLGLNPADLLLRCHPNWSEKIGRYGGEHAEQHYTEWAARRGVHFIASADPTNTLGLIEQSEAIVVSNGSAALEAGILGKQVIALAPSIYQEAGFRDAVTSPQCLSGLRLHSDLDPGDLAPRLDAIERSTLRFAYSMMHRVPQYTQYVRALSTTRFEYDLSADPRRFIDLLRSGELLADDSDFAQDTRAEDEVLQRIHSRDWQGLIDALDVGTRAYRPLHRRLLYRPVDAIRAWLPVGDR